MLPLHMVYCKKVAIKAQPSDIFLVVFVICDVLIKLKNNNNIKANDCGYYALKLE